MERYGYARQKLWEAVSALVGDGTISERLGYAFGHLVLLRPDEDLPADLRSRYRKLIKELADRADDGRRRPVRIITKAPKSGRLAEEILGIFTELKGGI